jgi:hypothetical protein
MAECAITSLTSNGAPPTQCAISNKCFFSKNNNGAPGVGAPLLVLTSNGAPPHGAPLLTFFSFNYFSPNAPPWWTAFSVLKK